ncbi:MAG: FG-GAP repeat domain-containing protein [Planctomycetota bacterium]|jgi:hypothetical protein
MRSILPGLMTLLVAAPAAALITFSSPESIPTVAAVADIVLADLDSDGDLDVAVLEGAFGFPAIGTVEILLNHGDGSFAAPVAFEVGRFGGLEFFVDELAAGDLDGDEDLDLAFLGSMAPLTLLFNDGNASFGAPVPTDITVNLSFLNTIMDLGDVDGDGIADAVVGKPGLLAFNDGSGGFTVVDFPGFTSDDQAAIVELSGDAALDIAYGGQAHVNDGLGGFTEAGSFLGGSGSFECAYADLDGDLDTDIACARRLSGEVRISLNNGDATFADGDAVNVSFPTGIAAGDLDGNGAIDLVARSPASIAIIAGGGDGTFGTADVLEMPFGREISIGDLNADGHADVVVGVGNTGTADPGAIVIFLSEGPVSGPGDVDGDGDVDINDFLLLLAAWGPCPDPPAECPADFDGDGKVRITDFLILLANFD